MIMRGLIRVLLMVGAVLLLGKPFAVEPIRRSPEQPSVRLAQWAPPPAYSCCTARGRCALPAPQPIGSPCQCYGDPGNAC